MSTRKAVSVLFENQEKFINPEYTNEETSLGTSNTNVLSTDLGKDTGNLQQSAAKPIGIGIPGLEYGLGITQEAPKQENRQAAQPGWLGYTAPEDSKTSLVNPNYHDVKEDSTMSMLAHILGIATIIFGPLMIFMIMRTQSRFVAFHALQATLFQCVITAGYAASFIINPKPNHIVFFGTLALSIVMGAMAALAANQGEWYEIPVIGPIAKKLIKE